MKRTAALVVCVLLGSATACGGRSSDPLRSSKDEQASARVDRVVDGDTVVLEIRGRRENVRLLGIDTPETVKPNAPVECFGPEASKHLKALLPSGTAVRLERDIEARDHFGRLLVYLWRLPDQRFVNLDLITGGYARTLFIAPNVAYRTPLSRAAGTARSAGIGLWGSCR